MLEARPLSRSIPQPEKLFPGEPEISRLHKPTREFLLNAIQEFDINYVYRTSKYDPERAGVRPCWSTKYGPGAELDLASAAAWLITPGKNKFFREAEADSTLETYMRQIGLIGENSVIHIGSRFDEIKEHAERSGRKIYSMDDLGPNFDSVSVNLWEDFVTASSKDKVSLLTAYAPRELIVDMTSVDQEQFAQIWQPGRSLYVKCCNTESGSGGVYRVDATSDLNEAWHKFATLLLDLNKTRSTFGLKSELVLQPEVVGENHSLQVFIDPKRPEDIQVVGISKQLNGEDGFSYAGNLLLDVNPQTIRPVAHAMVDLVDRLRSNTKNPFGFLMCDFFHTAEGEVVLFDPGLRPTAATPSMMAKMWMKEKFGRDAAISAFTMLKFGEPLDYAEVVRRVGDFADPKKIAETGYGILPFGHNHLQGIANVMLVTPTYQDYAPFLGKLKSDLNLK